MAGSRLTTVQTGVHETCSRSRWTSHFLLGKQSVLAFARLGEGKEGGGGTEARGRDFGEVKGLLHRAFVFIPSVVRRWLGRIGGLEPNSRETKTFPDQIRAQR